MAARTTANRSRSSSTRCRPPRAPRTSGASPAIITAALLHDLGHLLNDQGDTPTLRGVDDLHQYAALPFLRPLFDDDVLAPIKLHVDAKRYLCATRSDYLRCAVGRLEAQPRAAGRRLHARRRPRRSSRSRMRADAVEVRLWDDLAKLAGAPTPPLAHFVAVMEAAQRPS